MMKRFVVILLCLAVAVSIAGCRQQLQWTPGGEKQEQEEVWLEITDVDLESGILSVTWHNETAQEAIYGAPNVIERQEDGKWVSCAVRDEIAFIAIAYVLPAKGSNKESYSLKDPYLADQPGSYRIRSECYIQSGKEKSEKRELTAEFTLENTTALEKAAETVPQEKDLAFSAAYIRTDGGREGVQYPLAVLIDSWDALDTYYRDNKDDYYLERREIVYSDTSVGFLDACDSYTEDFFKENCLVLVLVEEGSGSIRHEVTKVCKTADGLTEVYIRSIVPECGTYDMALWHIIVELSRDDMPVPEQLQICWDDGRSHEASQKDVPTLTVLTPDGSLELLAGTSSWHYAKGDGTFSGMESCGMHPLQMEGKLPELRVSGSGEIKLAFSLDPDDLEVLCWSEKHWGNPDAEPETLIWEDGLLRLKPGNYIYQIFARWQKAMPEYGGNGYYSFYGIRGA